MAHQAWQKRLNDSGYKNWLKVSLALIESKEALHDFVEDVIKTVHNGIKAKLGSVVCDKTCKPNAKTEPSCPSCRQWVNEIKAISGVRLRNWRNANPNNWHNDPWEIAKCFMNDQGSKATAAANTGPDKTDLSGILNVLVNCMEFRNHLKENKLPEDVRDVRNELMHCATMSFNDAEMQAKVDIVIALLEDEKELKNLPSCQQKVKLMKSLKDSDFQLKPRDEDVCIDAALKSLELSVEAGEEIEEGTMLLFNKLHELIKENKDLENKFDVKINEIYKKLTEHDVRIGELESRVEKLEKGKSTSLFADQHAKSLFKNALQCYTQKKKIDHPKYAATIEDGGKYCGIVLVHGQKFESNEPKATRGEADQSAAEVALRFLGDKDSEGDNDQNKSPTKSTQQQCKSFKNLLQERALMHRILKPVYNTEKVESGFLCKVMYDGRWYSPDITPQSRKVDAEKKAAQFVLAFLDRYSKNDYKNLEIALILVGEYGIPNPDPHLNIPN